MNLDYFTVILIGERKKHLLGSSETSSTAVRRRSVGGIGEQVLVSQCQSYPLIHANRAAFTHTHITISYSPQNITLHYLWGYIKENKMYTGENSFKI